MDGRKNTKRLGNVSEAKILASLLAAGHVVLQPYGDNQRYDLVIDDKGDFKRVQVKTGHLTEFNSLSFSARSISSQGKNISDYHGQIEFFGVYVPEIDKCYLFPISKIGKSSANFRLAPPKKNYDCSGKYAVEYEIKSNGELAEWSKAPHC